MEARIRFNFYKVQPLQKKLNLIPPSLIKARSKAALKGHLKGVYGHLKDQMAVMRSCNAEL